MFQLLCCRNNYAVSGKGKRDNGNYGRTSELSRELSDEMGIHSTTAEMERNIEKENMRKEKEDADLRLIEEQEEIIREEQLKVMLEKREKSGKEKKEREEKKRVERRVESERREKDEKKRLSKENEKRIEIEKLLREENEKKEKEASEAEARLESEKAERESLEKAEPDRRSGEVVEEKEVSEFNFHKEQVRKTSVGETPKQSNEFDSKVFIGPDRMGLERKIREEIERKIRVQNIRCRNEIEVKSSDDDRERERGKERKMRDDICVRSSFESDESVSSGFRRPSCLEADKSLCDNDRILRAANEKNMELESERKKRIENEKRIQDETDRRVREENEKKIRNEIERNIQEESERKINEENERKIQEEAERKVILEKKKLIAVRNELRKSEEQERKVKADEERKLRIEVEWRMREESASRAKELRDQQLREDNEQCVIELERRRSFELIKIKETEQVIAEKERRKSFENKTSTSCTPVGSRVGSRRMSVEDLAVAAKSMLKSDGSRKSLLGDTEDSVLDQKSVMHKRATPRTSITITTSEQPMHSTESMAALQHRDSRVDGTATPTAAAPATVLVKASPIMTRQSRPSSAAPLGPKPTNSQAVEDASRTGVAFEKEKQHQHQQLHQQNQQHQNQQQQQQQLRVSPNTILVAEALDVKDKQLLRSRVNATAFQLASTDTTRRGDLLQQSQSDPIIFTLVAIGTADKVTVDSANADGRTVSPGSLPDLRKALKSLSESELNSSVKF